MAEAKTTTDHNEIRRWVEERGGFPASVKGTGDGNDPGLLRIDYPGFSGEEKLQKISWEEFFAKFDSLSCYSLAESGGNATMTENLAMDVALGSSLRAGFGNLHRAISGVSA